MEKNDDILLASLLADPATQRSAFGTLVNSYSELLYWKVRRIVLTHEDANDVLQNTFIKAWNNIGSFRNDSKISTWLYRIAMNESLDFLRRKKARQDIDTDIEANSVANMLMADEYFDGDETQAMLQEAISRLPDVQRTVFNMKYFDDMKYSEISRILGTSEGGLKASYHIAVKKISEYILNLSQKKASNK